MSSRSYKPREEIKKSGIRSFDLADYLDCARSGEIVCKTDEHFLFDPSEIHKPDLTARIRTLYYAGL